MEIQQPSSGNGSGGVTTVTDGVHTVTSATEITFSGATVSDGGGGNAIVTVTGGVTSVSNSDGTLTISPTTGAVVASLAATVPLAHTWSANGAVSAPASVYSGSVFTGGTATTTQPLMLFQPTGTSNATTWNTAGTVLGINAVSGFAGNILDSKVNNAPVFSVTVNGTSGNHINLTGIDNSSVNGPYFAFTGSTSGKQAFFGLTGGTTEQAYFQLPSAGRFTVLDSSGVKNYFNVDDTTGFTSIGTTAVSTLLNVTGTDTQTSGNGKVGLSITPTYNQASGTAANTDFLINRTQTAVGSGAQLFTDFQVAGTSKFKVSNVGTITTASGAVFSFDGGNLAYALGSGVQPILSLASGGTAGMSFNAGTSGSGEGGIYRFGSGAALAWATGAPNGATEDVSINRAGVGLLAIGTGGVSGRTGGLTLGSLAPNYVAKTAGYTPTVTDYTIDCTTGTFSVTLPTAVGITGRIYVIKNSGTGVITIATTSAQTIDGASTQTLSTQYSAYMVQSTGANWIII